jgi:enolase
MAKQDERWRFSEVMAYEILDSRGNPTVKVEVKLKGGASGRATR